MSVKNPVRPLRVTATEKRKIERSISRIEDSRERDAAMLYAAFSGDTDIDVESVELDITPPDVVVLVGRVTGIAYETVRDGKLERYLHEFKQKASPMLCASSDGDAIYLVGGKYRFTERGIVDEK